MSILKPRIPVPLVALVAAGVTLLLAAGADASTYVVQQCHSLNAGHEAELEGNTTGPRMDDFCAGSRFLQAGSSGATSAQSFRHWAFQSPAGTEIADVSGTYSMMSSPNPQNQRAYVFAKRPGQPEQIIEQSSGAGLGFSGADFELTDHLNSAVQRFGIGVRCANQSGGGNCPSSSGTYVQLGQLNMRMEDTVAPARPVIGGPATSGWKNGNTVATYSVVDQGAGVRSGGTLVNGTGVDLDSYCSPQETGMGHAKSMVPCPFFSGGSSTLDVAAAPFRQGDNTLQHCVSEYGNRPQTTCEAATIKVDTIEPGPIASPSVAGGDGWHRDNDFDISWSNRTDAPSSSPIVGAELRILGANHDITSWHPGNDIEGIENVRVPAKGSYTAQVYLVDAAGNKTNVLDAISHSISLQFDDTVPEPQAPNIANGWISRDEIAAGYLQSWENVLDHLVPPSGIAGYRVTVNTSADSDPCTGAYDPRACGGDITEAGRDNRKRVLNPGDLEEGVNYVHVVPVSGSGMRATEVKHASLKADFTDPVTQLQGAAGGGWFNHPLDVTATAHDALSGMSGSGGDDPATTFLQIDDQPVASSVGSAVSEQLVSEGEHQIKFWARDLAGNTEPQPNTRTVRIDRTAPTAAFANSQDPNDPDRLVAPVSDALSGVADGEISYRKAEGGAWTALETVLRDGQLVARVDSADMRPGATYEFRVEATDRAGNTVTSGRKENGAPMKVVGPFRGLTDIVGLSVNDKSKTRVKYGKSARVTGTLVRRAGGPVAGAKVALIETNAEGSTTSGRTTFVATDGDGGFSLVLPKGPSRTISARYVGDRRYLGTSSATAKLRVKGKVQLKVPKRVSSRQGITFRGKVGARGAKLTKRGKRLEVLVRVGRKWKTVGKSIRTNRKGRFKLAYRFTADYPRAVTYQFRAKVLPERGFPYLPTRSKVRRVVVTP